MASSIEDVPAWFREGARSASAVLSQFDKILVAAHVNPDGDAIGSMAACGFILEKLGKEFALYSPSSVPKALEFLSLPGRIYSSLAELPFEPAAAIYVDCSEPGRLGKDLEHCWQRWPSLNIDHHLCEHGLGSEYNFIEITAGATCQLIAYVACALNLHLTAYLAQSIGVGVITDTGNFTHGNTSADIFSLCALLERNGISLPELGEKLRSDWGIAKMHLWGDLFARVQQSDDGRIAWLYSDNSTLVEYGCTGEDLEGLIDWLKRLKGVQVALTLRELSSKYHEEKNSAGEMRYKFSLRSKGDINIQQVAAQFGGGGHRNASGGIIAGNGSEILQGLLAAIESVLASRTAT